MAIGEKVDKDAKLTKFKEDVIDYALSRVQVDSASYGALVTGSVTTKNGALRTSVPAATSAQYGVNPEPGVSFDSVDVLGGGLTASALVDLFQFYAYNLTSIRKTSVSRYRTAASVPTNIIGRDDDGGFWDPIGPANRVTVLGADHRMNRTTFKAKMAPLIAPFQTPGAKALESDLNNLIAGLKTIVKDQIDGTTEPPVNIVICHSSCHCNCHGSRGRR